MTFEQDFARWVGAAVDPNRELPLTERTELEARAVHECVQLIDGSTPASGLPDALDELAERLGAPGLGAGLRVHRTRTMEAVQLPGSDQLYGRLIG